MRQVDVIMNVLHTQQQLDNQQMEVLISDAIIHLMQSNPLLGNIMMNLKRQPDTNIKSLLALTWHQSQLILIYNHKMASEYLDGRDDLDAILEHLAMHIVWLHPIRYTKPDFLLDVAMDLSVNQYVSKVYKRSWTLDKLNAKLSIHLLPRQDSTYYLLELRNYMKQDDSGGISKLANLNLRLVDRHYFQDNNNFNMVNKKQYLKQLIQEADSNVHNNSRGSISHEVMAQVKSITVPKIDIHKLIRKIGWQNQLNYQDSMARFNRRQSYRMELPGRISIGQQIINIFVDSSGSITNNQFSKMNQVAKQISQQPFLNVKIHYFDAKVFHNNKQQIRLYNGGTSYQAVFDYIHTEHLEKQLSVIFTDGNGENQVEFYHSHALIWILIDWQNQLSLNIHRGRIIYLKQIEGL
jgi:predicted metal-dependent peptidase